MSRARDRALGVGLLSLGVLDLGLINLVLAPRYRAAQQSEPPATVPRARPATRPEVVASSARPVPAAPRAPAIAGVSESTDQTPPPARVQPPSAPESPSAVAPADRRSGAVQGSTWPRLALFFALDSAQISRRSAQTLQRALTLMREHPQLRLVLRGHSDGQGSVAHNQRLSRQRAARAAQYFLDRGVDRQRLEQIGVGSRDARTLATATDRRVDLIWQTEH